MQPTKFNLGGRELGDFVGQVLHETQLLERLEENLNYSAQRLTQVWPARFPTFGAAALYQYKPEALANKVYGGRMGNTAPGDGWRYRGRGIPQITGRDNYVTLAKLTGLPLVDQPELLLNPDGAMRCGVLWWEKKIPDGAIGSVESVTRVVNGSTVGLAERAALTAKASAALTAAGV